MFYHFDNQKIDQEQSLENCEFANAVSLLQCYHLNLCFYFIITKKKSNPALQFQIIFFEILLWMSNLKWM